MERGRAIECILKLEHKYKVESWTINSIHVWPLIRLELLTALLRDNKIGNQYKSPKNSRLSLLKDSLYTLKIFFKVYNESLILFAGADSHRINLKESSFNRYFDPVNDYLENNSINNNYLIEYKNSGHSEKKYYKEGRVIKFYRILNLFKTLNLKFNLIKVKQVELDGYDLFLKDALDLGFHIETLSHKKVYQKVLTIILYSKLFSFIINKIRPKHIFSLCYYNIEMLGLNLAAHNLRISSIDVQHGTQGPLHIAYTKWSKVPSEGYELLPNTFWCWDEDSYKNIEAWTEHIQKHKPILGGNFWNDYIFNSTEEYGVLDKNIILYTLQPVGEIIEDYIIDVIKETSGQYNWYLRLHPRQLNQKKVLESTLAKHGLLNVVNINEATALPLPVLLKNSYLHISKFSGSILEAAYFEVPSIIIDKLGVTSFENLIKSGKAQVCIEKSSNDLTGMILNYKKSEQIKDFKRTDAFEVLSHFLDFK